MNVTARSHQKNWPTERLGAQESALFAEWMSGIFIAPLDTRALKRLLCATTADFLDEIGRVMECKTASQQMRDALLAGLAPDVSRWLARRYTILFEGVSGRHTVPLCESAYTGTGARLFQKPFDEMRQILRHLDMSIQDGCGEPADHVALELAALAAAARSGDEETLDALRRRLASWTPNILLKLDVEDPGGFYRGAAALLVAFVSLPSGGR